MSDSARLPALGPEVVDGEVLPDGVLDEDIRIAEIGRQHRESGRNPNAVSDPRQVAEIRRRMEHHRKPWPQRVRARWSR